MSSTIKIDVHKGKLITFDLDIQGLDHTILSGKFRIMIEDVEYGFPTSVTDRQVEVYLPCLHDVLHEIKSYGGYIKAKLEVFADHHYFIPWEGKLKIVEPASVKAKVSTKKKPKVKSIRTEDKEMDEQQEVIVDDPEPEHEVTLPNKEKKKSKEVQTEASILTEETKQEYLQKLQSIDVEGIRDYMSRAGTKSETVQNIILEQAENTCKDPDNNFELLKSVIKVMKKIKSPDGVKK